MASLTCAYCATGCCGRSSACSTRAPLSEAEPDRTSRLNQAQNTAWRNGVPRGDRCASADGATRPSRPAFDRSDTRCNPQLRQQAPQPPSSRCVHSLRGRACTSCLTRSRRDLGLLSGLRVRPSRRRSSMQRGPTPSFNGRIAGDVPAANVVGSMRKSSFYRSAFPSWSKIPRSPTGACSSTVAVSSMSRSGHCSPSLCSRTSTVTVISTRVGLSTRVT